MGVYLMNQTLWAHQVALNLELDEVSEGLPYYGPEAYALRSEVYERYEELPEGSKSLSLTEGFSSWMHTNTPTFYFPEGGLNGLKKAELLVACYKLLDEARKISIKSPQIQSGNFQFQSHAKSYLAQLRELIEFLEENRRVFT